MQRILNFCVSNQASVRELRGLGISPDIIVCRSEKPVEDSVRDKISLFCHVLSKQVHQGKFSREKNRETYPSKNITFVSLQQKKGPALNFWSGPNEDKEIEKWII